MYLIGFLIGRFQNVKNAWVQALKMRWIAPEMGFWHGETQEALAKLALLGNSVFGWKRLD